MSLPRESAEPIIGYLFSFGLGGTLDGIVLFWNSGGRVKDGGWRLDGWMIGVGFGFLVEVGLVYCAVISMVIRVCEWWMESLVNG